MRDETGIGGGGCGWVGSCCCRSRRRGGSFESQIFDRELIADGAVYVYTLEQPAFDTFAFTLRVGMARS